MRRVVVTGANKGIGLAIIRSILEYAEDTFVYLGARNQNRGQLACASLTKDQPEWAARVEVFELDVSNDTSVAAAARKLYKRLGEAKLYGVVNNAGIGLGSTQLKTVLEVNTLGIRRVCEAFLPLLDDEKGRVVNITSASGPNFVARCSPERQRVFTDANIEWPTIAALIEESLAIQNGRGAFADAGLGDGNAYGLSKACANCYTMLFARENPNLRINACTPGFIETDLTRPYLESSGRSADSFGMKSPSEGTRAAIYLLFGEPEDNGWYYGSDAKRSPLDRYRSPGDPPYKGD